MREKLLEIFSRHILGHEIDELVGFAETKQLGQGRSSKLMENPTFVG